MTVFATSRNGNDAWPAKPQHISFRLEGDNPAFIAH